MARKRGGGVTPLQEFGAGRRGIYLLPNLITTMGLLCGIYSLVQTMQGSYLRAALAVVFANFFDVLDGRVARMTNTTSRFGVEYDSLCDLVSFGVAPGLLIYSWALVPWGGWGWSAAGVYVICAAVRLARFNSMTGRIDSSHFQGLPVPAAATMLASIILLYRYVGRTSLPDKQMALLLVTYAVAMLMVSTIKYSSGKTLDLHRRQPQWAFIAAVSMLAVAFASYQVFIFVGITSYVLSGPLLWALAAYRESRGDDNSADDAGGGGPAGPPGDPSHLAAGG